MIDTVPKFYAVPTPPRYMTSSSRSLRIFSSLSRRLTRWAYSIPMVHRSFVVVICHHPHFQTWISLKPVVQFWSHCICSIIWVGKRQHTVLRQIGSKLWFLRQPKAPIDLKFWKCCPENSDSIFDWIFINLADNEDSHKISHKLDFGPDFGPDRIFTSELLSLEWWKTIEKVLSKG